MFTIDRRLCCAGTATAVPSSLLLATLLWAPEFYPELWDHPAVRGAFPAERRRQERLDQTLASIRRRAAAKRALARDLADNRLTLLEAAARSRALDRAAPDFSWVAFRTPLPEATDEERHCREIIAHLRGSEPVGPTLTEELARQLEAELQGHLDRGTLRLQDTGE
jgi:hypothetical protein